MSNFEVKIIADSMSINGDRLTTVQLKYPRFIHSELMTHRVFSRNASSSRAIPVTTLAQKTSADIVTPLRWGLNQPGMQAADENMSEQDAVIAERIWKEMARTCLDGVDKLRELGLHKQWANRPLEWFGTITTLVSATEWQNFFALRDHPAAQDEIQYLAVLIRSAMGGSRPRDVNFGQWHLPYILDEERPNFSIQNLAKMSAARCARVSYDKLDGTPTTIEADLERYEKLVGSVPPHMSPVEHQATPVYGRHGNFLGWKQARQFIEEGRDI